MDLILHKDPPRGTAMKALLCSFLFPLFHEVVFATTRTSPPAGAIVVRAGTSSSAEFSTLAAAIASLPDDSSMQSIFIYPGIYTEQVDITRSGPLTVSPKFLADPCVLSSNPPDLWLHYRLAVLFSQSSDHPGWCGCYISRLR